MSRYTGPRLRLARALGIDLPGLTRKSIERRPYPPGQHGQSRRKKSSEYKQRLQEKQKLRFNYGLSEAQFSNLMKLAGRLAANPAEKLVELLERRLDNVVFRAGFGRTIPAARQLVGHRHILVDGKVVDRPGYRVRDGQVISLSQRSRTVDTILASRLDPGAQTPKWLDLDVENFAAKVSSAPDHESLLVPVDLRLIVEYYATR